MFLGEKASRNHSRRWGHTTMWASDGAVTLHIAASRHLDVVLLNLESSLSDGCRVTRQRRRGFEKKVCFLIAFTERDDDDCRQQYQAAGIDVLFVRPVEPPLWRRCYYWNVST